ncbi:MULTISPECIES: LacI family DNA-binding transcriptional regulator [Kandleria]|jgi:LacI family transcriptional regulator|uniref:LacI family DNA-binding transcriptional regulator n=1 Tax=Kandleria TaxID=1279388 RepID=UPI001B444693|nr:MULTISPECIES: LacI family DNA-binding transcriptional regulator [Kandleria]MBP3277262.1 LacI family DNA-binding transcriptional regulator [Kandleria sp.]MEE0988879.1 LacI family DNA-binding transcriptional regulator [Kandleria vitulina]
MKKTTIYDVAEEAGVSLATVSRVINGSNVVKPATREKVLEVIRRLDFKPNQIARGLATSKTTTIAIVFPQALFGHVKDMIGGIGDTGRTLDYNITIYTTEDIGDGDPVAAVLEKVIKSRADGVVLFNSDQIDHEIEIMKKYNLPTVVVGYKVDEDKIGSIYVDASHVSYDLAKKYLAEGKEDIVFVRPQQNLVRLDDFVDGIKKAFEDAGKSFDEDKQVINTSTHYEESYPFFIDYFKTHKHDVVLTGYDKEAVAVVNAAQDNGISIPDDMQVVGMMNTSYSIMSRPSLTTIHVPVYEMGAMAIRLMTKMLNEEEIDQKAVPVVTQMITRNTTK